MSLVERLREWARVNRDGPFVGNGLPADLDAAADRIEALESAARRAVMFAVQSGYSTPTVQRHIEELHRVVGTENARSVVGEDE